MWSVAFFVRWENLDDCRWHVGKVLRLLFEDRRLGGSPKQPGAPCSESADQGGKKYLLSLAVMILFVFILCHIMNVNYVKINCWCSFLVLRYTFPQKALKVAGEA